MQSAQRLIILILLLPLRLTSQAEEFLPFYSSVPDSVLAAEVPVNGEFSFYARRTDRGMYGHRAGKGRMYYDIVLPPLTPSLLIDVGMAMAQVDGLIGMTPRWFAMFSPLACTRDELFGFPKSKSAIMFTWRTYF